MKEESKLRDNLEISKKHKNKEEIQSLDTGLNLPGLGNFQNVIVARENPAGGARGGRSDFIA